MADQMDDLIRGSRKPGVFADYWAETDDIDPTVRSPHFGVGSGYDASTAVQGPRMPYMFGAPRPSGEEWLRDVLGDAFAHQRHAKGW